MIFDDVQARLSTQNAYHFVGGCQVGEVIDEYARVLGFQNLRVVDSSSIPNIPSFAGPASSVYMLAEWVAELIINAE